MNLSMGDSGSSCWWMMLWKCVETKVCGQDLPLSIQKERQAHSSAIPSTCKETRQTHLNVTYQARTPFPKPNNPNQINNLIKIPTLITLVCYLPNLIKLVMYKITSEVLNTQLLMH